VEVQIFGIRKSADTRAALRFFAEPLLLRMPLVRWRQQLTIGLAEETWAAWYLLLSR